MRYSEQINCARINMPGAPTWTQSSACSQECFIRPHVCQLRSLAESYGDHAAPRDDRDVVARQRGHLPRGSPYLQRIAGNHYGVDTQSELLGDPSRRQKCRHCCPACRILAFRYCICRYFHAPSNWNQLLCASCNRNSHQQEPCGTNMLARRLLLTRPWFLQPQFKHDAINKAKSSVVLTRVK
ncbi:hypothetical protein BO78DRAFT_41876 [Aspergillus sclerotiicarbonarius CBS 121057]|uniref:Uncharacterized protein n=1 Tax=Aspergillus sclerotiicarbonarius (strain CBS 121057 / IBT 28362) TaxID=1448318 RepID=A0A319DWD2_ASPSB|nr:hypothetical protein BO78DRAFT_41876 [Aspergillus sclerotiicarbonarius CBS 121057]